MWSYLLKHPTQRIFEGLRVIWDFVLGLGLGFGVGWSLRDSVGLRYVTWLEVLGRLEWPCLTCENSLFLDCLIGL